MFEENHLSSYCVLCRTLLSRSMGITSQQCCTSRTKSEKSLRKSTRAWVTKLVQLRPFHRLTALHTATGLSMISRASLIPAGLPLVWSATKKSAGQEELSPVPLVHSPGIQSEDGNPRGAILLHRSPWLSPANQALRDAVRAPRFISM